MKEGEEGKGEEGSGLSVSGRRTHLNTPVLATDRRPCRKVNPIVG